ncbi:autotransporter domain-containing protein [Pelagibacterales bacterium SAG-MED01]|nr:autotransporter domain-containing protein [Pelagibacterales bacterium SAG-MED01]
MFNFLKKIFSIFLIFNLTFVSSAQAAATFDNINGDGTGFDVTDQGTNPESVAFNNDGTKMFVVDKAHEEINVYTLTTGFDLSTATFNDINGDGTGFDVSGKESNPQGIAFNNDGTKMFVVGTSGDDVNEYTLSVGFDLTSTVTFVDDFDISGQDTTPRGLAFNNDGTKMFVVGDAGNDVNEYTLSVGFDLTSTVTFVDDFDISGQDNRPRGMAFNNDGTKMYVLGYSGEDVNVYTLSTGFDLTSTVTFVDSFDVSNEDDGPVDIAFNNTGSKMFVVGLNDDEINSYSLSCGFKVTNLGKCEEPPKIKDVRGIVDAQINTAKKFAEDTRVATFKRLDILRANKYQNTSTQNIELNFQNELLKKVSNNVVSSTPTKPDLLQSLDQFLPDGWEVWNEGSISFGKIGGDSLSSAQDIDGFGITVGADRKMDEDQILGVAVRAGNTDVDVGTFGSKVDTNALSLSLYGINSLEDKNFLKHVFGVSYLDSDIRRNDEGNTNSHTGERKGRQVFGSLDIGREYEDGDLTISSIGSIDGSYTALDSYTESGTNAISYNDQDINSLMASLGVLIDKDVYLENSNVKSRVNLEYGKEFASNSKVVTSYVSDSESFEYQADNKNRDIYTAGLGLDFKHDEGLTISTDYERQQIKGHGYINKFTFSTGFLYRNETELALELDQDMTSNFKISKALDGFDLEFNLENDFSNQENHNANLSLSSKF